jgi:hypothetical protein
MGLSHEFGLDSGGPPSPPSTPEEDDARDLAEDLSCIAAEMAAAAASFARTPPEGMGQSALDELAGGRGGAVGGSPSSVNHEL